MTSAGGIRETLRYARRFVGQVFVMRLDTTERLDVRFIDDLKILLALGIRFVFICKENSAARTNISEIVDPSPLGSPAEVEEAILRKGVALALYGHIKPSVVDEQTLQLTLLLQAAKLFFMTSSDGIHGESGLIREMDVDQAEALLVQTKISGKGRSLPLVGDIMRPRLTTAIRACNSGVHRVHFLNTNEDGSLLEELFLADGSGTLIYQKRNGYATIRQATQNDLTEVIRLLSETHVSEHARHDVETALSRVIVRATDEQISGCIMVTVNAATATLRFAAASGSNVSEILTELVEHAYQRAISEGASEIVFQNPNQDWLSINPVLGRLGFKQSDPDKLWRVQIV